MTRRLLALPLLLAALAFAAAPATAQDILFADFESLDGDGNPENAFAFGDAGFGAAEGVDGGNALSVGVDGAGGQGFAGAGTFGNGGSGSLVDISGAQYITFFFDPGNIATDEVILQVNLQEDVNGDGMFDPTAGTGEDEFQALYRINPSTDGFEYVMIPIAAFTDDNVAVGGPGADDGFDFTKLLTVVFAFGDYQTAGAEFTVRFDEITFTENLPLITFNGDTFADFEALDGDGNPENAFAFGDAGFGAGDGIGDGTSLSVGVDGAGGQGFAGAGTFGNGGSGSLVDISGAQYILFEFDPGNIPNDEVILQVNLQEDVNGDGMFDPTAGTGEDEFQALYRISPLGDDENFRFVALPIAAFTDDNVAVGGPGADDGFDFTKLLAVVYAFGDYQTAGAEFTVRFDDIQFIRDVAPQSTAIGELPASLSGAPVAFPNPTAGAATVTFELAAAQAVAVDVFDLLGRRVATLADGPMPAGPARLDLSTSTLAPGLYVVRVRTDAGVASTRLTVLR